MGASLHFFSLLLPAVSWLQSTAAAQQQQQHQPVTFGSAIILEHEATRHKLYSGKISWSSASAGQAVTAQPSSDSPSFWLVRPPPLKGPEPFDPQQQKGGAAAAAAAAAGYAGAGAAVPCGAAVALQHVGSWATLRAAQAEAPLSPNYEVAAAPNPEGLSGVFVVECTDSNDFWRTGQPVKLKNKLLNSNLQASTQHMFNYSNCGRGCPIAQHLEVSVSKARPSGWSWGKDPDLWVAQPHLLFAAEGAAAAAAEGDFRDEL